MAIDDNDYDNNGDIDDDSIDAKLNFSVVFS